MFMMNLRKWIVGTMVTAIVLAFSLTGPAAYGAPTAPRGTATATHRHAPTHKGKHHQAKKAKKHTKKHRHNAPKKVHTKHHKRTHAPRA